MVDCAEVSWVCEIGGYLGVGFFDRVSDPRLAQKQHPKIPLEIPNPPHAPTTYLITQSPTPELRPQKLRRRPHKSRKVPYLSFILICPHDSKVVGGERELDATHANASICNYCST